MRSILARLARDQTGSTMIEFTIVALLFFMLTSVSALLYPLTGTYAPLPDDGKAIDLLAGYVATARDLLLEGSIAAGIDAEDPFSDTRFALPSQADAVYLARKEAARYATLADLTGLWSEE